jgi:uncharacterized cupin superfamily protein
MLPVEKRPIDLPAIGERLEFTDARERTGGLRSDGILTLGPGRSGPEAHAHILQVEGFEVLSGALELVTGGSSVTLRAGESFLVSAGVHHTFRNADETSQVVALLPAAHLLFRLRRQYRLASMPFWAQDLLFGVLSGVASLTGRTKA